MAFQDAVRLQNLLGATDTHLHALTVLAHLSARGRRAEKTLRRRTEDVNGDHAVHRWVFRLNRRAAVVVEVAVHGMRRHIEKKLLSWVHIEVGVIAIVLLLAPVAPDAQKTVA